MTNKSIQSIAETDAESVAREHLVQLLEGGFAPVVILLREFHFDKTSHMFDGLPFSAWGILEHMRWRQSTLIQFMKNPDAHPDIWPEPFWPENNSPDNEDAWNQAIDDFEKDLKEVMNISEDPATPLFQRQKNEKSIYWAAVAILQHNAYHIGQIKTIGRQLGVW